jgi:predicted DNA-binding transcriptional regulator YafY
MSPRADATAEAILQRLLLVLPLATRDEGARIEELARSLELEPRRILQDLKELEGRSYYLPAGMGDQFQLTLTRDHLSAWTTGEFQRPVRLTPREALALELALRLRIREERDGPEGEDGSFEELRRRLVEALRIPGVEGDGDAAPGLPGTGGEPAVALGEAEADADPVRRVVEDGVRERRELTFTYLPPGRAPEPRRIAPLLLAHAEGSWYLLARDLERDGHRAFRLDRILEVGDLGEGFTPAEEDLAAVERFLGDGRIHDGGGPQAPEPFEAVVEYSPVVARWIRERNWDGLEDLPEGGVRATHRVVDPEWLLRHVLSYGGEARVLEPRAIAERLVEVTAALVGEP